MPGQPNAKRNAQYAKGKGEKAAALRKAAATQEKPKDTAETVSLADNPIWQAQEARKQARLAQLREEGQEWINAQKVTYTKDQCLQCIELLSEGYNLKEAAEALGLSYTAVMKAVLRDQELKAQVDAARELYAHERVKRAHAIVLECEDPARARILADLIKWEVSKVLPKFYGDKVQVEAGEGITFALNIGQSPKRAGRQAVKKD